MSEVKEQNGNGDESGKGGGFISTFLDNAATKGGETIGELAVNSLVGYAKKKYQDHLLLTGEAFNRYLTNSINRLNQIKTIATGGQTRSIMGKQSIYVEVGVSHRGDTIPTNTVNPLLEIKNYILIEGTGGAGKSMLMRYLFLKTAEQGDYLPVFLNLRQISRQKSGEISILNLIHDSLQDYDREFGNTILWEQFVYSLNHGKYLFLMDGFDEIKESMAVEAAEMIQKFCAEFPWNACIITTRPEARIEPLETFETMKSLPLSKDQAIELVKKIWGEDEQTLEFCHQLEESLFDDSRYNSFACNPLLLSMMGLTFLNNNFIPDSLKEFYEQTFETLYRRHDAKNKGAYRREFQCNLNSEESFKKVFSHFCFKTYLKSQHEFSEHEILSALQASLQKAKLNHISARDYLLDLRRSVCMIIHDGNIYKFSHRSFQTYFAAYYTAGLSDEEEKKLFSFLLHGKSYFTGKEDYYALLSQIIPSRFFANALEEELRNLQDMANNSEDADIFFLKAIYRGYHFYNFRGNIRGDFNLAFESSSRNRYVFNIIDIFKKYVLKDILSPFDSPLFKQNMVRIRKFYHGIYFMDDHLDGHWERTTQYVRPYKSNVYHRFDDIDSSTLITERNLKDWYFALCCYARIPELRVSIKKWLAELDAKRAAQKTDTLDDLIDSF